jgi:hypothetical protein
MEKVSPISIGQSCHLDNSRRAGISFGRRIHEINHLDLVYLLEFLLFMLSELGLPLVEDRGGSEIRLGKSFESLVDCNSRFHLVRIVRASSRLVVSDVIVTGAAPIYD